MSSQGVAARRSGWVEFAVVVLFAVAFFRIIEAIAQDLEHTGAAELSERADDFFLDPYIGMADRFYEEFHGPFVGKHPERFCCNILHRC